MNPLPTILVIFLSSAASALYIQQEFEGVPTLKISVGTPPQGPFEFRWNSLLYNDAVKMPSIGNLKRGGVFDPDRSSTFKQDYDDGWGIRGSDVFKFTNGFNLTKTMFRVEHKSVDRFGEVGFSQGSEDDPSFFDNILWGLEGSWSLVLGITHRTTISAQYGTIAIGADKPNFCHDSWTHHLTHTQKPHQMVIYSTGITVEKYHDTAFVPLAFTVNQIALHWRSYLAVVDQLRVKPDRTIDCKSKATIVVRTDGQEFVLGPEEYIENHKWYCLFTIKRNEDMTLLPLAALKGKCLSYDLDRTRISFGTML